MVSMEGAKSILVTLLRLGKWTLFVLVALSYLLLDVEYDDQVENNHGFKVDLPLPERANAMNSRVALHSSVASKAVPALQDKAGLKVLTLKSSKTTNEYVAYYRDPRVGINPFGILPSTLVGLVAENNPMLLPTDYRAMTIESINSQQPHIEVPVGGTLKLDCDGDFLIDAGDKTELNRFLNVVGKTETMENLAEKLVQGISYGDMYICKQSPTACTSEAVYKSNLAEYVSAEQQAPTDKIAWINKDCDNFIVPTDFASTTGKKNEVSMLMGKMWNEICHNEGMLDFSASELKSFCDDINVPTDIGIKTTSTEFCDDLDRAIQDTMKEGDNSLLSESILFFNMMMNVVMLNPSQNKEITAYKTMPETDVLKNYKNAFDNTCASLKCGVSASKSACSHTDVKNMCVATLDYLDAVDVDIGGSFTNDVPTGKVPLFTGDVKEALKDARTAAKDWYYTTDMSRRSVEGSGDDDNQKGTGDSGTVEAAAQDSFKTAAEAVTTDALSNAPHVSEETQEICHDYQNGQMAAQALLWAGLGLMGLGLLLILASLYENVLPAFGSLSEMIEAYKGKSLSFLARAANFCGYMFIMIAALVNRHYNGKGDAITVYMSTIIFGDLHTLNQDSGLSPFNIPVINAAEVMPNQPISFGIDDGYVKHQMKDELDEADPSFPYDRHLANILFYVAISMFTIDIFLSVFWNRIKGNLDDSQGGLGETTMMSRLMTSIL